MAITTESINSDVPAKQRPDESVRSEVHKSTAVLDLGEGREPVIKVDGHIVIDARDKVSDRHPRGWTDRAEMEKYSRVVAEVRQVIASTIYHGSDLQQVRRLSRFAVISSLRDLGHAEITDARVLGKIPPHWSTNIERGWCNDPVQRRFIILDAKEWKSKKQALEELGNELAAES